MSFLSYPYLAGGLSFLFSLIVLVARKDALAIFFFIPIIFSGGMGVMGRALTILGAFLVTLMTHMFAFKQEAFDTSTLKQLGLPIVIILGSGAASPILFRLIAQRLAARSSGPKQQKRPAPQPQPRPQAAAPPPPPAQPQPTVPPPLPAAVPPAPAPAAVQPSPPPAAPIAVQATAKPARSKKEEDSLLKDVSKAVKGAKELSTLCASVLEVLRKPIPFEKATVNVVDAAAGTFADVYLFGIDVPGRSQGDVSKLAGTFTETVVASRTGRLVQPANDQEKAAIFPSLLPNVNAGILSFMAVPLLHDGRVVGTLHLRSTKQLAFTQQDLALVERAAALITPKMAQLRPPVPAQAASPAASPVVVAKPSEGVVAAAPGAPQPSDTDVQEALAKITETLSAVNDIGLVYDRVAEQIRRLIPFDRIVVSTADLQRGTVTVVYSVGVELPGGFPGYEARFEDTLFQTIVRGRRGLLLGTDSDDRAAVQHPVQLAASTAGLPSLVAVPLVHQDRVVGTLEMRSKRPKAYWQVELMLAHRAAAFIAGAVAESRIGVVRQRSPIVRRVVLKPGPPEEERPSAVFTRPTTDPSTPAAEPPPRPVPVAREPVPAAREEELDPVTAAALADIAAITGRSTNDNRGVDDGDEAAGGAAGAPKEATAMDDAKRLAEQSIVVAELRSEVQEHRALAEMGRSVATAQEPAEAYAAVASQLVHLLSVDSLHLVLVDEAEGKAAVEYVFGRTIEGWEAGRRFAIAGTAFESVVRDRTHLHAAAESSRHLGEGHPLLTFAAASGIASIVILPLVFRGHAVAAMAVGSAKPHAYQRRDQELAERAAGLLAGAVAQTQRTAVLRKASEMESALSRLAASLASTLDMKEVFLQTADGLTRLLKYDRLVVNDIDAEKGQLVRVFVAGADIAGAVLGGRQPIAGSTVAEVMRTRSTVLVSGLPDDDIKRRFPSSVPAVDIGLKSFMTAPLISDGKVVATLHVFSKQPQAYSERDAALLGRAAGLLSSAAAGVKAHAAALEVAAGAASKAAAKAEDPMAEIGRVVWSAPDLETMYGEVGQQLRKMVPFERFAVWAVDIERGALVNIYAAGVEGRNLKRGEPLSLMRSQAEIGLGGGGRNGQQNGGAQSAERLSYLAKGIAGGLSGLILVPLLYGNEGVGMLTLGARSQGSFTQEHETIAERVGQLVAARVGFEQLNDRRGQTAQRLQEQVERLGAEVVERTGELERVRAELDTLKAAVHKDLRSSLTTIEGASQAVLDALSEGKGSEGRVQLLRVRAASKTIAQQLDALVEMSDVSSRPMQRGRVDLTAKAKASARKLRQTEQDRHVTLSVEPGLTADGDPDLVEVMLDNLLPQAWKRAAKAQKPKVQLRAEEQGGKPIFALKDNGEGMSPKAAKAMFTAGHAVTAATPKDELAAALAKRVVDRHGGRVWAESEPGKGTTVYFTL